MKQYELEINNEGEDHFVHTKKRYSTKEERLVEEIEGVYSVFGETYSIKFRIAKLFDLDAVIREIENKLTDFYKKEK